MPNTILSEIEANKNVWGTHAISELEKGNALLVN